MTLMHRASILSVLTLLFAASTIHATPRRPLPEEHRVGAYTLSVHLPDQYNESTKSFPVVFAMDGDASFDEFVSASLARKGEMESIVVGVGFGLALPERRDRRIREYIPEPVADLPGSGSASILLEALESKLIPFVEDRYRTQPGSRMLAGHSLGGLFTAWVMLERPDLFDKWVILSPSLAVTDLSASLDGYRIDGAHEIPNVILAVGSEENPERMKAPAQRFAEALKAHSISVDVLEIAGADHAGIVTDGLDSVFSVSSDEEEVRAAVEGYFEGIMTYDADLLRRVFHPDARIMTFLPTGDGPRTTRAYYNRTLASWLAFAEGTPPSDTSQYSNRIVSVDIAGNAAMVKTVLEWPEIRYVDYLSLLKMEDGWRIIAKIWHQEAP